MTLGFLIWGTEPQSPGAGAGPEERWQAGFGEQVESAVPAEHPTSHSCGWLDSRVWHSAESRPRGSSAHRRWLTPWDGWDRSGRVCRVRREMTRVRSLPSRSSQSSCVLVQAVYPQLDCKLLEGSYHFHTAVPRQPWGLGVWKPLGQEKSGLRNLGPYWGKNRVRGMKSRVNLWNHHIFTLT